MHTRNRQKGTVGSTFDEFLKEEELETLTRAARAVGRQVKLELV
jgi:hypothetical protein